MRENKPPAAEGLALSLSGIVMTGYDNMLTVRVENGTRRTIRIPTHLEKWTTLIVRSDKGVRTMRGRATHEVIPPGPMELPPGTDYEQRLMFPGADGWTGLRLSLRVPEGMSEVRKGVVESDWYMLLPIPLLRF